ncbi:MAG TPA: zinc ribbon domain-containing protein [Pyrinomonadaceae bacterium]|nr:zinc ribbon domain-containing protein [Pyrinomonadaceae bacterium]
MFCPQCGVESAPGQQYCRSCGANVKVIAKAVTLSEAVARADRGPLPKIKELINNFKMEHATEDVSHALEEMNQEIVESIDERSRAPKLPFWAWWQPVPPTPAEQRRQAITSGVRIAFSGVGVGIFLYFLAGAIILKLPPEVLAKIPFELAPVIRMIWMAGLIQIFAGVGRVVSGLLIDPDAKDLPPAPQGARLPAGNGLTKKITPAAHSVTESTTELLHRE